MYRPVLDPIAGSAPGVSGTVTGRGEELALLGRQIDRTRARQSSLVLVTGASGIGKSSLLRAFLDDGRCDGTQVLRTTCDEATAGSGYGGVRALFAPLGLGEGSGYDHPLVAGAARRALPALHAVGERPCVAAQTDAYPVLYGLYWLAVNLMADRPLVLAFDDVQWCDERSLRWIDFLLRRADDLPLLIVLAQRSDLAPVTTTALADIAAQGRSLEIHLAPLGEQDVERIVQRHFLAPPAPSFVARAAQVSGGNPLVLTRLMQRLSAESAGPDEAGAQRLDDIGQHVVAMAVHALFDRQPGWVRDVATAVAVLGTGSTHLVSALAGVPGSLVHDAVSLLREAEMMTRGEMTLVHDAVRTAVLESLGDGARGELRARAALLLSDAGRPAEEVANQLLLIPTSNQPWMPAVLREAAAQAERRGAPEAAVRYLERLLKAEPDSAQARMQMARYVGELDPARAVRLLKEVVDLAGDVRTRAMAAVPFGLACLGVQDAPAAVRVLVGVLDELEAEIGADPDPADRELRTSVESALLITGADEKSTIAMIRERMAGMRLPPGDTPAQRQLVSTMTMLSAMAGEDRHLAVENARRALHSPDIATESWSLLGSALVLGLADEVDDSLSMLEHVVEHSQRRAAPRTCVLALSSRAHVLHSFGMVREAMVDAQLAVDIAAADRWGEGATMPQIALAVVMVDRGEPERAETVLGQIRRPNMDRFVWEYHWYLTARARARWALGDHATALRLLLRCGASLREVGLTNPAFVTWWVDAACLLARMGRAGEATEIVEYGTEAARRWGTPRVLGLSALARGIVTPGRAGIDLLTESVETLEGSPALGDRVRAGYLLGTALLAAGDHPAARERLYSAAELAQRCGALALARVARQRLVAGGGRMREIASSPVELLTGTERRVAELAAKGESNRTIAELLFVTVRTVETHLTSVYRKLRIVRRSELESAMRVPDGELVGVPAWVRALRGPS